MDPMPDVVDPNAPADPNAAPAAVADSAPPPAAPVRPEGLADEFWDDASGVKVDALFGKFKELSDADAARAAEVPDSPDGYTFELPAELAQQVQEAGLEFKADDPRVKAVATALHGLGLPKAAAGELFAAYAAAEVQVATEMAKTVGDEVAASYARLGEKAEARVNAVNAAIRQHAGQHADALLQELTTGDAYIALEAILAKATGVPINPNTNAQPNEFEGLYGADLINAIRAKEARG